jgi:nucleoid-associated protein YgaU
VVKGDNLWAIAKKYLGNGNRYMEIYNANKVTIGSNPALIRPGQALTIPS